MPGEPPDEAVEIAVEEEVEGSAPSRLVASIDWREEAAVEARQCRGAAREGGLSLIHI